jgi:hypothetical protein
MSHLVEEKRHCCGGLCWLGILDLAPSSCDKEGCYHDTGATNMDECMVWEMYLCFDERQTLAWPWVIIL